MDVRDKIRKVIKLIDPYSTEEELEVFTQNRFNSHNIPNDVLTINDFTLHCIAAMAKQYGLVVVRDTQNYIWVGEYKTIEEEIEQSYPCERIWKTLG